jgi:putative DNA primase/helicase
MTNQELTGENPNKSGGFDPIPPGFDAARETMNAAELWGKPPAQVDEELSRIDGSDTGNALRFKARFGQDYVYALGGGRWLFWDGMRWALDVENRQVRERMAEVANACHSEARYIGDQERAKQRSRWAIQSRADHRINAALHMAEVYVWRNESEFDLDPLVLNTASGTLDLRSGDLRPHSRADYLTRLAPFPLDPQAVCPTWMRFLEDITGCRWDDPRDPADDPLEGLQRLLGYAASGLTVEHVMAIFHGSGSNGKSLLLDVMGEILGDYAGSVRVEALMSQDQTPSHQTDLVQLRGKRLVVTVESEGGKTLNESLVKSLTGGDKVSAREIYSSTIEFRPQFMLIMATNHLPHIRGFDYGIWRRLICVPFDAVFVDAELAKPGDRIKDPDLKAKLLAEAPGVLAFIAWGFRLYQRDGLRIPKRWREASAAYRTREDGFGEFLRECTVADRRAKTASGDLKAAYDRWAAGEGIEPMSAYAFGLKMKARGFQSIRTAEARLFQGLRLTDEWAFRLTS